MQANRPTATDARKKNTRARRVRLSAWLGRNVNVPNSAGGRGDGRTILTQPFKMKFDGLPDFALDFLDRCPGGYAPGRSGTYAE